MIDFLKYYLINTDYENIEGSIYLDFIAKVNKNTGEIGAYIYAFYRGLEFRIYETTEKTNYRRITVEGSLHKYWNEGTHNFNDFGINGITEALKDLKNKFNILPENCILRQLEIGVNLTPPYKTKILLQSCIMHKTKPFKWIYTKDEGNYIQLKNQRHFIKLYDKKTHYQNKGFQIDNEIMRLEKKWCKMIELNNKGIYTLEDLIKYDLRNFKSDLLKLWQDVLYCDLKTIKGTKNDNKYNNVNWWNQLKYENFKYHRNQLNNLLELNPNNTKKTIANLIEKKVDFLNTKTTEINPLDILLKTVVSTSENTYINCYYNPINFDRYKNSNPLSLNTEVKEYCKQTPSILIKPRLNPYIRLN